MSPSSIAPSWSFLIHDFCIHPHPIISSLLPLFVQVKISQPDLKLQTVWDNIWGVVQVVFLADGKVMTVHKTGELHVYKSIQSKAQVALRKGRGREGRKVDGDSMGK